MKGVDLELAPRFGPHKLCPSGFASHGASLGNSVPVKISLETHRAKFDDDAVGVQRPQQRLNFLSLPQGHDSLRPTVVR